MFLILSRKMRRSSRREPLRDLASHSPPPHIYRVRTSDLLAIDLFMIKHVRSPRK